jgi:hypothetical protein
VESTARHVAHPVAGFPFAPPVAPLVEADFTINRHPAAAFHPWAFFGNNFD